MFYFIQALSMKAYTALMLLHHASDASKGRSKAPTQCNQLSMLFSDVHLCSV